MAELPATVAASLTGSVAWVTGAGDGLGRDIATALHTAGATVVLTSRSGGPIGELAATLSAAGAPALALPGSVADSAFVRSAADRIVAEFGRLDVLVNMAGINPAVRASTDLDDTTWDEIIGINLTGTFYCCREAGRHMLARRSGCIVNVSSVHGSTGVARMAAYGASKGGVENLTRSLAIEWARSGVRVNCLAPGYFRTAMTAAYLDSRHGAAVRAATPLGRPGETAEITALAVLLASPQNSYMTGAIIPVDGGWTAQ